MDNQTTTVKIKAIREIPDEKTLAQLAYDEAKARMLMNPSQENIEAFGRANAHLYEVEDAYRIGTRLLTERAKNLKEAFFGLVNRYK